MTNKGKIKHPLNSWAVTKLFFIIFLPLWALLSGILLVLYKSEAKADRFASETNEAFIINMEAKLIAVELNSVIADLMLQTSSRNLNIFLDSGGWLHKKFLAREFLLFSQTKRLYDQIRFLNETGMEIVRVNFSGSKPYIVPDEDLQLKTNRYYFQETFRLERGEVYVSPFDLNIEHGEIEQPLKPTIRFGSPVFDKSGRKRGVLILNYFGLGLIQNIEKSSGKSLGQIMLLNSDGFWLKDPQKENKWGFMSQDGKDRTFNNYFPEAWQRISNSESGQFYTSGAFFVFTTVYPLRKPLNKAFSPDNASDLAKELQDFRSYKWKLVTCVPMDILKAESRQLLDRLVALHIVLSSFLAISTWFYAGAGINHNNAEQELRKAHHELEQRVEKRTAGLKAVNFAAERFLKTPLLEENIDEVLGQLGKATEASRVYIFEIYTDNNNMSFTNRQYEWVAPGITPQIENSGNQKNSLQTDGFKRWEETLIKGRHIYGHVKDFPEKERDMLGPQGIRSILVVPIFVQQKWWGGIGFDECLAEREWALVERSTLGTAADIIGAAMERKQAMEQIKASLNEKEVLLKEIHHRVKNNLQIISSLLDMSRLQLHDKQAIELFTDASAKINTMGLIHLQLYKSERFDHIEMGNHIQEIFSHLSKVYAAEKWISHTIEVSVVYLPLTQAIPCALVLTELISNTFKHAFKGRQQGTIKISMEKSARDSIVIKVRDDGIGFSEGVDIFKSDNLGLKLVKNLVQKQLKGKIQVKHKKKGTDFITKFKIMEGEPKSHKLKLDTRQKERIG